ncbi:hypothetical protein HHK36_007197 [Tetracentron sinense]|uniref:YLP motif-containing protein 1 n=1 Tax=Tetracentron sinense TaxID=13715 RepID=A0A834ZJD3_TETSI|nr:hypothetical protein HHK36_007197 [Tetracentron sinense]
MEHSWRFRPIQGNICPICSISHFPFCSQPPTFDRNGFQGDRLHRFPLENNHSFHRPFLDPFLDHQGAPVIPRNLPRFDHRANLMMPVPEIPNDVYGNSQTWHRNQHIDSDLIRQFPQLSQMAGSGTLSRDGFRLHSLGHDSNEFMRVELFDSDRANKRMRVGEIGSGSFKHTPPPFRDDYYLNSSRVSSEDERRLNLIRDHGGQLNPPSNMRANNLYDPGFDSVDKNGPDFHPEKVYDYKKEFHKGELSLAFGYQYSQSNRDGFRSDVDHAFFRNKEGGDKDVFLLSQNEEPLNTRSDLIEKKIHPSSQTYGHSDVPTGGANYVELAQQSQDSAALNHKEEYRHNMDWGDRSFSTSQKGDLNQQPCISHHMHYHISEGSNEKYHIHNLQQFRPKDSMPAKEIENSHITNWQVSSGSNVPYHEQRISSVSMEKCGPNTPLPQPYALQHPVRNKHDLHFHGQQSDVRQSFAVKPPSLENIQVSAGSKNLHVVEQCGAPNMNKQGGYLPISTGNSMVPTMLGQVQASQAVGFQPPLPPSPPPPLPVDPPGPPESDFQATSLPPRTSFSLYPIPATSSATVHLWYPPAPENQSLAQTHFHNGSHLHASTAFVMEGSQVTHVANGKNFPMKHLPLDKPKVVDASCLFRQPHRATRPDHFVIVLRGLPGSGKSYLAKMLRDLEVENGGDAPRIHSMDDYFMTEVEKVEESEVSKSSSSVRGKKPVMKKVIEYCYEPEMEEMFYYEVLSVLAKPIQILSNGLSIKHVKSIQEDPGGGDIHLYNRSSGEMQCLCTAFIFTNYRCSFVRPLTHLSLVYVPLFLVLVDDRNLRVADFAQFWAIAKGCAARNVHGFTQDEIQKMAGQWEEAPPVYLQLDIQSLFHGDNLNEGGIQEVDMDTEDGACEGHSGLQDRNSQKMKEQHVGDYEPNGSVKNDDRSDAEIDDPTEDVKELGRSKWSDDMDEEDFERTKGANGNSNALSGLIQAYGKGSRSVHWGDQVGKTGFSIGAAKRPDMFSLVIGPGAGYNLKSNPLLEEYNAGSNEMSGGSKTRCLFQEQLRAESESFRAVFDRRRQRIGGFDVDDEW